MATDYSDTDRRWASAVLAPDEHDWLRRAAFDNESSKSRFLRQLVREAMREAGTTPKEELDGE